MTCENEVAKAKEAQKKRTGGIEPDFTMREFRTWLMWSLEDRLDALREVARETSSVSVRWECDLRDRGSCIDPECRCADCGGTLRGVSDVEAEPHGLSETIRGLESEIQVLKEKLA